jgi:hypothetical protein
VTGKTGEGISQGAGSNRASPVFSNFVKGERELLQGCCALWDAQRPRFLLSYTLRCFPRTELGSLAPRQPQQ